MKLIHHNHNILAGLLLLLALCSKAQQCPGIDATVYETVPLRVELSKTAELLETMERGEDRLFLDDNQNRLLSIHYAGTSTRTVCVIWKIPFLQPVNKVSFPYTFTNVQYSAEYQMLAATTSESLVVYKLQDDQFKLAAVYTGDSHFHTHQVYYQIIPKQKVFTFIIKELSSNTFQVWNLNSMNSKPFVSFST